MSDSTWSGVTWHKSSRSGGDGNCVEVAVQGGEVAVRDSKSPDGAMLVVSLESWQAFLRWVVENADDLRPHSR